MPARIFRTDDVHCEFSGPVPLGPIAHPFEAAPTATQSVLAADGHLLLRAGDGFGHVGRSHQQPLAGTAFANPGGLTREGRFCEAGQDFLFVNGKTVMTLAGSLETCCDAARETTCDAAVLFDQTPILFVQGSSVLPGNH